MRVQFISLVLCTREILEAWPVQFIRGDDDLLNRLASGYTENKNALKRLDLA